MSSAPKYLCTSNLKHKTGIDLTVSSTLNKPSKNYTCFILRRFGLFLIHLQSENKQFNSMTQLKDRDNKRICIQDFLLFSLRKCATFDLYDARGLHINFTCIRLQRDTEKSLPCGSE